MVISTENLAMDSANHVDLENFTVQNHIMIAH